MSQYIDILERVRKSSSPEVDGSGISRAQWEFTVADFLVKKKIKEAAASFFAFFFVLRFVPQLFAVALGHL